MRTNMSKYLQDIENVHIGHLFVHMCPHRPMWTQVDKSQYFPSHCSLSTLQFTKDVVEDGAIKCVDMRRECDGQQEVLLYYFDIEDVVRDLVADKMALGKQHLSPRVYPPVMP